MGSVAEAGEVDVSGVIFLVNKRGSRQAAVSGYCQKPLTVALSANGSNRPKAGLTRRRSPSGELRD